MSSTGRAWIVAASIGAVEALKDHGFCRWNYTARSLHQHALRSYSSYAQSKMPNSNSQSSSATTSMASISKVRNDDKTKQSEESLRKVMYLSCWGPN